MIQLINPYNKQILIEKNDGLYEGEQLKFPYLNGAFRLTQEPNYTDNFGLEWNEFQKTQIDKFSGKDLSQKRFFAQSGWTPEKLKGKNILEVGSGAGRFSQIVLDHTEANLYSVDFSNAVEANYRNNGSNPRFKLFQASIYELPFEKESFDYVFCFGVLQHTPDFKKSVQSLIAMVKKGGEIAVDFYPIRGFYTKIHAKYLLRPFTRNMDNARLMKLIRRNVGWMTSLTRTFNKIGIGKITNRFIPICDIEGTIPKNLSKEQQKEWIILDTFDMFSPKYDDPQKISTVARWFEEFGLKDIQAGFINYADGFEAAVVKGVKP